MVTTVKQAALLLQQVAQIASEEVSQDGGLLGPTRVEVTGFNREPIESLAFVKSSDFSSHQHQPQGGSHKFREGRFRTVSVSTPPLTSVPSSVAIPHLVSLGASPLPPPPMMMLSRAHFETHTRLPIVHPISPPQKALACPPSLPVLKKLDSVIRHVKHPTPSQEGQNKPSLEGSKFVGTTTPHKVKGTLRHKFSWKNYPELEEFLIGKRDEYLRNSSANNYTSKQKQYNNMLTTQLLERASSSGYVFDQFTFVQVRDRIRCYYKSYLQSCRKRN